MSSSEFIAKLSLFYAILSVDTTKFASPLIATTKTISNLVICDYPRWKAVMRLPTNLIGKFLGYFPSF